MAEEIYLVRYLVEPWGGPVPEDKKGTEVIDGVTVMTNDFGYCDNLFLASITLDEDGEIDTILLMDSDDGLDVKREILEKVRDQINHVLEHHR